MTLEIIKGILTINNLLMMNIGMATGIIIGCLPGLNVIFAITVLLPLTFGMSSTAGIFMLLGAYCGATYGGSISAILINTPGTPNAAATVFDGYPMAQKGHAGDALKIALYGSTIGGIISALALLFLAPQIAKLILNVASPEYFALCIFGLFAAVGIAGKEVVKGTFMALLGLLLATVGADAFQGTPRFTFGSQGLLSGFRVAVVMLGAYAMSEVMIKAKDEYEHKFSKVEKVTYVKATIGLKDMLKYWKTILKASLYGVVIGAVPGTGGAIAAMFSYNDVRRSSKNPEEFGTGIIEGLLAPETANNATTGATMIPLLTLGIPGDAAVAVLLGALTMQGITPGTQLFTDGSTWVYIIMGGLLLVNVFMLLQGQLFTRLFANVTRVPVVVLLPIIMVLCTMGSYAIANSIFDVFVMLAFGLLGYLFKRFGFPIPPMTIGMVLGYLTEAGLRRSLLLSKGSLMIFIKRPFSCLILLVSVATLFYPLLQGYLQKKKTAKE